MFLNEFLTDLLNLLVQMAEHCAMYKMWVRFPHRLWRKIRIFEVSFSKFYGGMFNSCSIYAGDVNKEKVSTCVVLLVL